MIGVLNVFHLQWSSLLFASVYKLFNPDGFVYLKMDNCHYSGNYSWEKLFSREEFTPAPDISEPKGIKTMLKNAIIPKLTKFVDLWSIEDTASCEYYEKKYTFLNKKIITVLNGHTIDIDHHAPVYQFSDKKNIKTQPGIFT
ncbi:MAG: hypothetical protein NTW16_09705 [Bacteroidetes bacterium]|nr:hypothetical protein [Bacteroidota bacterium]